MQNPKLPFAAIHADPDLTQNWNTRFGPTAFALPKLERYHELHIRDLIHALNIDKDATEVYLNLFRDTTIRKYILRNMLEELPLVGKEVFVKDAQKVIPSLKASDIEYAEGYGGMRPQIVDKKNHQLMLGEAKLKENGIIFNMTPSPGATSSLSIAMQDTIEVCRHLGKKSNKQKHKEEIESLKYSKDLNPDFILV